MRPVFGPLDEPGSPVVTIYKTDKTDRVEHVTDPDGGDASRGYDDSGNIDTVAAGTDTSFTYNSAGENLSEVTQGTSC